MITKKAKLLDTVEYGMSGEKNLKRKFAILDR